MPGRILVVEDDPSLARSLRRLLAHEEYYVVTVGTAEEAQTQISADPSYDLVLMDVTLPRMDGYTCCRQLRSQGWRQPIIMLTGRQASRDRVIGLEMGADDYVTKPFEPAELLARVRAQLRRSRDYNAPDGMESRIQIGPDLIVDMDLHDAVVKGEPARLTSREFDLLALMARHLDTALKKTWLFQQVWGCASDEGIKLLAVTIRRLRLKIEEEPDHPTYILTIRGFGYKLTIPRKEEGDPNG